jgi:O-antigen/teichoic acid export membrane protein
MTNNTVDKILQKFRSGGAEGTLLRGAGSLILLNPLSLAISFLVMSVLVPRVMSVESNGIYTLAMTYLQLGVLLSLLGQDTALLRFVPQYSVHQKWGHLRGIIAQSARNALLIAVPLALILAVIIFSLRDRLGPEATLTYFVTLPLIPLLAFTGIRESSLRALKKVVYSYIPDSIIRPVILGIVTLLVFLITGRQLTAPLLMGFSVFAVLGTSFLGGYWLFKSLPRGVAQTPPHYETRHWLKVALPLFFISAMSLLLKRTDVIILGIIKGPEEVGIYGIATRLADLAAFGLMVVNMIAAPMISELYSKGNRQELQKIITLSARGIFILTLLITLMMVFGGKVLLGISGQQYIAGYTPLLILLAGQVVNALSGSVGFIMTMTGYQNQAARIFALGAVVNTLLNILLTPHLGMNGSAIATAITTVLWNVIMLIFVMRKLKINPTVIS